MAGISRAGTTGTRTRYVFTAPRRDEPDLEISKASGFYQASEIAADQFVERVLAMKQAGRVPA